MKMKTRRQSRILELITQYDIETQEELLRRLDESGLTVTQATISRDIKELRLVKVLGANGKYRYVAAKVDTADQNNRFFMLFAESVTDVSVGGNIVCIKCHTGMAQAVCASMDTMKWSGLLGTLAGEDTIFALCSDDKMAGELAVQLRKLFQTR